MVEVSKETVVSTVRNSASKPVNLSSRGDVATTSSVTVGFVVGGSQVQSVLVRGAGPSLSEFGVTNPLANVNLALYSAADTANPIATSTVVSDQAVTLAGELGAFPLTVTSGDAGIVATLAPGAYTVIVSGANNEVGNVIVEIY